MDTANRQHHWENAYSTKGEQGVSWFEDRPETSLDIIRHLGATGSASLVDVGGGASRLVDVLLAEGWPSITVLDISSVALETARKRIGAAAGRAEWIVADVTQWAPTRSFDIWHDRAVFHFLTEPEGRTAYVERLADAVRSGGHAVIATFALDGPERCSGLPVMRYDASALSAELGPSFVLIDERKHIHSTPWGSSQSFQYSVFRRA